MAPHQQSTTTPPASSTVIHPAALERHHIRYSECHHFRRGLRQAVDRARTQHLASMHSWGNPAEPWATKPLRCEYLGYTWRRYAATGIVVLEAREYRDLWRHDGSKWHPIMPWQHHDWRLPDPQDGGHLYSEELFWDDYCPDDEGRFADPADTGVAGLAEHVEQEIRERIGIEPPPWFDHPCPPDSLAHWSTDETAYEPPSPGKEEIASDWHDLQDMQDHLSALLALEHEPGKDILEYSYELTSLNEAVTIAKVQERCVDFLTWLVRQHPTGPPPDPNEAIPESDWNRSTLIHLIRDDLQPLDGAPITWLVADRVIECMSHSAAGSTTHGDPLSARHILLGAAAEYLGSKPITGVL